MKKISIVIITIIAFFSMLAISTTYADEAENIILESNVQKLKAGEEIQITVKCNQTADNAIQIITGKLEFDTSVLQIVANKENEKAGMIEQKNDWISDIGIAPATFSTQNTNSKNGEMFTVTMKVLKDSEDAKITATNINLVNENYETKELKSNELIIKANKESVGTNKIIIIAIIVGAVIIIATIGIILKNKKSKNS